MKKKLLAALLATVMLLGISACGPQEPASSANAGNTQSSAPGSQGGQSSMPVQAKDSVVLATSGEPIRFMAQSSQSCSGDDNLVLSNVYDCLLFLEPDGELTPALAESYEVSEDGLTYTVTIVDATFQNGDPLTAEDVVFSYESAMQNSRFNYVTSFINKVEAKDDKTVLFHLDYPYSAISHTFWTIKIFSKREYEEIVSSGKQFGTEPHTCGTGPYILTSFDSNGTELVAYENYWNGAPEIKKVHYQVISDDAAAVIAFENGELDYFNNAPTSDWDNIEKAAGEDRATMISDNDIHAVFINWQSPTNNNILGKEKVREAIFYAISKTDCIQPPPLVMALPPMSICPPSTWPPPPTTGTAISPPMITTWRKPSSACWMPALPRLTWTRESMWARL